MTDKRKVTFILEGNGRAIDSAIHELGKIASEANAQPELEATMTTEPILDFDTEEQDDE